MKRLTRVTRGTMVLGLYRRLRRNGRKSAVSRVSIAGCERPMTCEQRGELRSFRGDNGRSDREELPERVADEDLALQQIRDALLDLGERRGCRGQDVTDTRTTERRGRIPAASVAGLRPVSASR